MTTPDTPLSERSDIIEEEKVTKVDTSTDPSLQEYDAEAEQAKAQEEHDATMDDAFWPEDQDKDSLEGLELDFMSLTTLKWMRKAGSMLVRGETPTTIDEVSREVSIYLLAHDIRKTARQRSKLFRLPEDDLEEELDVLIHELNLTSATKLMMEVAEKIAAECATLAIPVPDDDADEEGDSEGN